MWRLGDGVERSEQGAQDASPIGTARQQSTYSNLRQSISTSNQASLLHHKYCYPSDDIHTGESLTNLSWPQSASNDLVAPKLPFLNMQQFRPETTTSVCESTVSESMKERNVGHFKKI